MLLTECLNGWPVRFSMKLNPKCKEEKKNLKIKVPFDITRKIAVLVHINRLVLLQTKEVGQQYIDATK